MSLRIPVISDTHGLLRQVVIDTLAGAPMILHAGDVGTQDVLDTLRRIAPVHAIRGNVDRGDWAQALPSTEIVDVSGCYIYLIHDRHAIDIDPGPEGAGVEVVVSGHSHRPEHELRDGITWLNPGSVGPRRFTLPISMAWLTFDADAAPPRVEFQTFEP